MSRDAADYATSKLQYSRSAPPTAERPLAVAADWAFQFIGTLAPDGTLIDANRSALAFAGVRLEDVVGRPFWDTPWWTQSEQRAWLRRAVKEAAGGSLVRAEVEHTAPDGRRIFVDFSLVPVPDDNGEIRALLAEGRDLTDRKHVEEERRTLLSQALVARRAAEAAEHRAQFLARAGEFLNSSLEYDATFERLAALIVPAIATFCVIDIVDDRGAPQRVQVVHERPEMRSAARRLADYPRERQRVYLTSDAIHRGKSRLMSRVDDAFLGMVAENAEHLSVLRALAPASYIVAPLIARGRILGAIALCRDETAPPYDEADLRMAEDLAHRAALALDNARLYDQARRSAQARDDMLGLVSHDLRNPLSAISMCVHALLERDDTEPARRVELLGIVRDSADWANRMIEDLLDVSAIEAGRLSLERRPVDPVLVAAQAMQLFEPMAEEQGITLDLDLPEYLPRIHADSERLLQALGNLLGNALKFTPSGGHVRIHGSSDGTHVVLSVADTGPGVPAEDVPFIFDRFWHARRTAKARGTGLGLAIVKGIAGAHNGRAWVDAVAGGGSRFSIAIPVLEEAAPSP